MTPNTDSVAVLRAAIDALEYAAFNLDGLMPDDLPPNIIESTGASKTALIAARNLRAHIAALEAQGEAVEWQYRIRKMLSDGWGEWLPCCREVHDEIVRDKPANYETRALYLHPAPPGSDAVTWTPKPTKSGWHWHFDGDVTRMQFVFPRPGHSYLAVYDEPNPTTGKRNFRMAEKMGGQWCGPLTVPELPPAALAARTGKGDSDGR